MRSLCGIYHGAEPALPRSRGGAGADHAFRNTGFRGCSVGIVGYGGLANDFVVKEETMYNDDDWFEDTQPYHKVWVCGLRGDTGGDEYSHCEYETAYDAAVAYARSIGADEATVHVWSRVRNAHDDEVVWDEMRDAGMFESYLIVGEGKSHE